MSKLIRFLSSRWTTSGSGYKDRTASSGTGSRTGSGGLNLDCSSGRSTGRQHSAGADISCYRSSAAGDRLMCRVQLLDGTDFVCDLPAQWLDSEKSIKKQLKAIKNFSVHQQNVFKLRVRYYPPIPHRLQEELTRYQLFLQVKFDVLSGRLPCTNEQAAELAALALQSELGDYDPAEHSVGMISEFRFVPNQTQQLEAEILERFKNCRGMTPAVAEMKYLNTAKLLDLYGVDIHPVTGRDGNVYKLGLTPTGIIVFEDSQRIGLFVWPKIAKLQRKRAKIILDILEDDEKGCEQVHTFIFRLASERSCKLLWSSAVEHHIFFRLTGPSLQSQTGRPSASNRSSFRSTSSLFRSSSSKFSLFERRMQREMSSQRARGGVRRSVNVVRRPSQRHPRRPSSCNGTGLQRSRTIATTHGRDNRYTSSSVSSSQPESAGTLPRPTRAVQSNSASSRNGSVRVSGRRNSTPAVDNSTGEVAARQQAAVTNDSNAQQQRRRTDVEIQNKSYGKENVPQTFRRSSSVRSLESNRSSHDRVRNQERRRSIAVQQHHFPATASAATVSYPDQPKRSATNHVTSADQHTVTCGSYNVSSNTVAKTAAMTTTANASRLHQSFTEYARGAAVVYTDSFAANQYRVPVQSHDGRNEQKVQQSFCTSAMVRNPISSRHQYVIDSTRTTTSARHVPSGTEGRYQPLADAARLNVSETYDRGRRSRDALSVDCVHSTSCHGQVDSSARQPAVVNRHQSPNRRQRYASSPSGRQQLTTASATTTASPSRSQRSMETAVAFDCHARKYMTTATLVECGSAVGLQQQQPLPRRRVHHVTEV